MSESYILVNETVEQYVDPHTLLPQSNEHGNQIPYDREKLELLTATRHIDWAIGKASWILPYLVAESRDNGCMYDVYGPLFGAWSGDAITLVGGETGTHDEITRTHENISQELFEEVTKTATDLPPANID